MKCWIPSLTLFVGSVELLASPFVHPYLSDVVHVNPCGQYFLYRSYRGAILKAVPLHTSPLFKPRIYRVASFLFQFSSVLLVLVVFSRHKQTATSTTRINKPHQQPFTQTSPSSLLAPFLFFVPVLFDSAALSFNFYAHALKSCSLAAADKRVYVRENTAGSCQWLLTVT